MHQTGERQVGTRLEDIRLDHRERYRWACERLPEGAALLDAGCGVGYGSALLSAKAASVVGLDASDEAIAFADRHWSNEKIAFGRQDLHFLHFDAEQPLFDAAVCFECIEHLAIPELFLLRLRRYLKPGAMLLLSVPFETMRPFHPHLNPYHFMHYTLNDLHGLLARAGFVSEEVHSQDDDAVLPNLEGRFLVCQARMLPEAPAADLDALAAELPARYARQLHVMGNELAKALGVRKQLERRDQELADARKQMQEARNQAQEARNQAQEARLQLQKERATNEASQVKSNTAEIARLHRDIAELRKLQQENRKRIREVWDHPAFRRLARMNWYGLRLLSIFGLNLPAPGGRTKPSGREHAAAPSRPEGGKEGKDPAQPERLTAAHETYVRGFVSAAHVYGARDRIETGRRIAVDISRLFDDHLTGVGHYCDQLTRALLRRSPHEIVLYSGRPLPDWVLNYPGYPTFVHCPPNRVVSDFAKAGNAPELSRFTGPIDAYIDASVAYSPIVRTKKMISTVYDLAPISCPETVPEAVTTRCYEHTRFVAKESAALIAISEYSRQEFAKHAQIDPARISVVPVGLDPVFQTPVTPEELARVRARFQLTEPYILCVGTLQPRKNLARLIEAYGRLCAADPETPRLILTGTDQWAELPDFGEVLGRLHDDHRVEWIGYVDRGDMPALYHGSTLFVYPSYFEGYGMPVAEAMASGAAVVCGNLTSLPEVAGDAAEYCDPFSVDDIAAAMQRVLSNPEHAAALRTKAALQAKTYLSWDDVADAYLKAVDAVIKTQAA